MDSQQQQATKTSPMLQCSDTFVCGVLSGSAHHVSSACKVKVRTSNSTTVPTKLAPQITTQITTEVLQGKPPKRAWQKCASSALQVHASTAPALKLTQLLIVGKWCKWYKCGGKCACDSKKCACDSKKCVSSACPVHAKICNFGLKEFGAKMMVA